MDHPPWSSDLSRMIVDGLLQVGFDTSLFSGISARRGGLSTAIEPRSTSCGCRAGTRNMWPRGALSSWAAQSYLGGLRPVN